MARLRNIYREKIVPQLRKDLGIENAMEVPKIVKITVNMGVGEAVADKKVIEAAAGDLAKITGQKPVLCQARKSIASFKVREGLAIGCKVTLRAGFDVGCEPSGACRGAVNLVKLCCKLQLPTTTTTLWRLNPA